MVSKIISQMEIDKQILFNNKIDEICVDHKYKNTWFLVN